MSPFEYSRREIAIDFGVFGGVAVLLVAVHVAIPSGTRSDLAASGMAKTSLSLIAGAYVHAGTAHLLDNLAGYATCGLAAYWLCLAAGRRSWFRMTALSYLLLLPVLVNTTTLLILREVRDLASVAVLGFSGVVAGFAGLLVVSQAVLLRVKWDRPSATYSTAFFLAVLAAITFRLWTPAVPSWSFVGALAVAVSSLFGLGLHASRHGGPRGTEGWLQFAIEAATVTVVLALLSWFILTMFPITGTGEVLVADVAGHGAGFVFGILIAFGTEWLTRESDAEPVPSPPDPSPGERDSS